MRLSHADRNLCLVTLRRCSKFHKGKWCCLEPRAEEEGRGKDEVAEVSDSHFTPRNLQRCIYFPTEEINKERLTNIFV